MEDLMAGELATRGGSAEGFQARQLHYDAVADADLVLALESHHRRVLIEEYPQLHKKTFVLGTAARAVDEALPDEDKIAFILRRRPQRRPGDSIGDPYRRGPAAAQKAAAEIQLAVDKIFG
ncbi:hypothetical protein GCM10009762_04920 [Dermacoccus barathri]|uniref:Phosphotyrosine protein phosphatase I domain-containing protein n=2 Tax=Dermacoccus barathri TaxID=322601 RepID=A0ABN2B4C3_9MICO